MHSFRQKENKINNRSIAQKQSKGVGLLPPENDYFQFVDNRPEVQTQKQFMTSIDRDYFNENVAQLQTIVRGGSYNVFGNKVRNPLDPPKVIGSIGAGGEKPPPNYNFKNMWGHGVDTNFNVDWEAVRQAQYERTEYEKRNNSGQEIVGNSRVKKAKNEKVRNSSVVKPKSKVEKHPEFSYRFDTRGVKDIINAGGFMGFAGSQLHGSTTSNEGLPPEEMRFAAGSFTGGTDKEILEDLRQAASAKSGTLYRFRYLKDRVSNSEPLRGWQPKTNGTKGATEYGVRGTVPHTEIEAFISNIQQWIRLTATFPEFQQLLLSALKENQNKKKK